MSQQSPTSSDSLATDIVDQLVTAIELHAKATAGVVVAQLDPTYTPYQRQQMNKVATESREALVKTVAVFLEYQRRMSR